jgi:flagellar basal-body rod modification protein FlgD
MSVNAIQSYQSTLDAKSAATQSSSIGELEDRFLTLLVTQLKNQDPMNPMENAELTTQLAQMSTVEGINKLNASFESLLSGYQASQTLQAAALIDRTVLVEGNLLALGENGAAGRVNLAAAADTLKVRVTDADGNLVKVLDLGANPAGDVDFAWDGTDSAGNALATGNYHYSIDAASGGSAVAATTYALGLVGRVALSGGSAKVEVLGIGSRDMSQIVQIF